MDKRDEVLERFSKLALYQLDKIRDKKAIEYKDILKEYYKTKEDIIDIKFKKRKEYKEAGNSANKTEQLLRSDEELYRLNKRFVNLQKQKKDIELQREVIDNFYWKNKGG